MDAMGATPMSTPIYDELVAALSSLRDAGEVVPAALPARLSVDTARAVELAEQEARVGGHRRVELGHLLVGLLLAGGAVSRRLRDAGLEPAALRRAADRVAAEARGASHGCLPTWSSAAAAVLDAARVTVTGRGGDEVAPDDLLAALAGAPAHVAMLPREPHRAA